jgi:hypothetical protein
MLEPLRAVLLTIDAAKSSGVAVYVCGRLHSYAEADSRQGAQRRQIVRDAITTAEVRDLPLGAVIEVPFGGYTNAALSLSASVELWRDTWRSAGQHPDRMLEFTATEWRRALFDQAGMPRAQARRLEATLATAIAHRDLRQTNHYTLGADAAAAICIGQVAIVSSAVAAQLGLSPVLGRRPYTP